MKGLVLALGLACLACSTHGDELHIIPSTDSTPWLFHAAEPTHLYTASIASIGEILASAMGFPVTGTVNPELSDRLNKIGNNLFSPVHYYWMLILIGIPTIKPASLRSHIVVNFHPSNSPVDLFAALQVPSSSSSLGGLIQRRSTPENFIIFESTNQYLYHALAPNSMLYTKNTNAFYGGTPSFIEYLRQRDILYDETFSDVGTSGLHTEFLSDLREIPRILNLIPSDSALNPSSQLSRIFDDMQTKSMFNFLSFTSIGANTISRNSSSYENIVEYFNSGSFYTHMVRDLIEKKLLQRPSTKKSVGFVLCLDNVTMLDDTKQNNMEHLAMQKESDYDSRLPYCYSSEESCISRTNNCSGYGNCIYNANSTGIVLPVHMENQTCWICECSSSNAMTGPACQYQDWSDSFFIILVSVLIIIFTVLASIYALAYASRDSAAVRHVESYTTGDRDGDASKED